MISCLIYSNQSHGQYTDTGETGGFAHGLFSNGFFFDKLYDELRVIAKWIVIAIRPRDPNQIIGPDGYAAKKWMSVKDRLNYKRDYDYDANLATAAAQNVYLHLPVDKNININSFRLGSYGFNQYNFFVPANTTYSSTRLDLRDSLNLYVGVTAGIDIVNHKFFRTFRSIDPLTGKTPTDLRGLLSSTLPVGTTSAPLLESLSCSYSYPVKAINDLDVRTVWNKTVEVGT